MMTFADQTGPSDAPASAGKWSVVIPVYNEEAYLQRTLESLAAQTAKPIELILVDNASTDRSIEVAKDFLKNAGGVNPVFLSECRPGRISALQTGIAAVGTEFVALCDADTVYPRDYLERAGQMMSAGPYAAALAFGVYEGTSAAMRRLLLMKGEIAARLMPKQGHSGGYAQAFRTAALKASGGYSPSIWPFTVADHELVHRVLKEGPIAYSRDHWCLTSARRADRRRVDWTLFERVLYHLTPADRKDWLFYKFFWRRFAARKMLNANLRQRDWEQDAQPQS